MPSTVGITSGSDDVRQVLLEPVHPSVANHFLRLSPVQIGRHPPRLDTPDTLSVEQVGRFVKAVEVSPQGLVLPHNMGRHPKRLRGHAPCTVGLRMHRPLYICIKPPPGGQLVDIDAPLFRTHLLNRCFSCTNAHKPHTQFCNLHPPKYKKQGIGSTPSFPVLPCVTIFSAHRRDIFSQPTPPARPLPGAASVP